MSEDNNKKELREKYGITETDYTDLTSDNDNPDPFFDAVLHNVHFPEWCKPVDI